MINGLCGLATYSFRNELRKGTLSLTEIFRILDHLEMYGVELHHNHFIDKELPKIVEEAKSYELEVYGLGPHGDLIVMFAVEPHDTFIRRGLHIYLEQEIPFPLAVAGGETEVPTMHGSSKMKVSKGTEGGTLFRMKGKGVHTSDGRKGDQLVRVQIQIPRKLSKDQKEYLRKYSDVFT